MSVKPDNTAIGQRWDAFFHQTANFVMTNTDIIVLTAFSSMLEVSVYSVYNLVANGLRKVVLNFTNGLEAAFGSMFAMEQKDLLRSNFSMVEYMVYAVGTIIYTVAAVTILEFVKIYTNGITDVDYIRPLFAYLIIIAQFFMCVRQPYQLVVQAAGHYKQTKNGAIAEPILNIVISLVLVINFGLVGVAWGTLVAALFRTIQYAMYVSKKLIPGIFMSMIKNCIISGVEVFSAMLIFEILPIASAKNYFEWIINTVVIGVISLVVVILFSFVFKVKELKGLHKKISRILTGKKIKDNLDN
jgi:O-antigen/teichoic acid export membrane protein